MTLPSQFYTTRPLGVIDTLCSVIVTLPSQFCTTLPFSVINRLLIGWLWLFRRLYSVTGGSSWSSSILHFFLVSLIGYVLWLWLFLVNSILLVLLVSLTGYVLWLWPFLVNSILLVLLVSLIGYVLWLWLFQDIFYTTLPLGVMDRLCSVIVTSWSSSILLFFWCHGHSIFCDCESS